MPGAHSGRVVVVGHVEWVTHARGALPLRGHIADLAEPFDEPAGGGGVASCAAARMGAPTSLITALGADDHARAAREALEARGIAVHAARRAGAQTPVLCITEPDGERTIMVVGDRLQPRGDEALAWHCIDSAGAAYYTGEDPGALVHARVAAALVVSARRVDDVIAAGIVPDVLVGSARDPAEDPGRLPAHLAPAHVVLTEGAQGGRIVSRGSGEERFRAVPAPGRVVDTYGCGDSFAAGLTVGLARGLGIGDAAALGALAGAECATWRGGSGPVTG